MAAGEAIQADLESEMETELFNENCTGMFFDMLRHSLHRVDWRKIGEAFREP